MCGYRALRGACSGDCGAHRLLKNSIQRSSPTKSCVLYRFVVSIGGFVDMNFAKSGDFWFYKVRVIFTGSFSDVSPLVEETSEKVLSRKKNGCTVHLAFGIRLLLFLKVLLFSTSIQGPLPKLFGYLQSQCSGL